MQEFNNHAKFKSYMKKEASRIGISTNGAYSTFFARALLDKLSKYNDGSILVKGSSAETAYIGTLVRGITDVDLALLGPIKANMGLFYYALEDKSDPIRFKLSRKPRKTPTGIIQVSLLSSFYGVEQTINVDLQENYSRLLMLEKRKMPRVFEGDVEYTMLVPSFEEYIAEKLCIILETNRQDVLNTRVKDFYDIFELHGTLNYNPEILKNYFPIMMKKRGKILLEDATTLNLDQEFIRKHADTWASAITRYDFLDEELLGTILNDLRTAKTEEEKKIAHEKAKQVFAMVVGYTRSVIRQLLQENGVSMPVYVKK